MLVFLSVLLIILVLANVLWDRYISNTFDPFLYNEKIQAIPDYNRSITRSIGRTAYGFRDYDVSGYYYGVDIPRRLDFVGNITIGTYPNPTDDGIDHSIHLRIFAGAGGNWTYALGITDFNEVIINEDGWGVIRRASAVDMYGEPLRKHPKDTDEFYNKWLELHNRYYNTIKKLFYDMKEYFGEDAFQP